MSVGGQRRARLGQHLDERIARPRIPRHVQQVPDVLDGCMAASVGSQPRNVAETLERSRVQVAIESVTLSAATRHL